MPELESGGEKRRVLSLFSGCGGMDIGFEGGFECLRKSINEEMHPGWIAASGGDPAMVRLKPTGFETVFANDIRPGAKAAWVKYHEGKKCGAEKIYHVQSIVDLVKKAKCGEYSFPEDIDVVTGGFPCQDFSVAGKRMGFSSKKNHMGVYTDEDFPSEESRGKLYMWMREVISLTLPKMFIAENVKGLANLGEVKNIIEKDFASAGGGYLVVPAKVLHAPDYGVPQSRERIIFIGFRKEMLKKKAAEELSKATVEESYSPYPAQTHSKEGAEGKKRYVTTADAFAGLVEPEESDDTSQQKYSRGKYMGRHCQGQTEVKLDGVGPTIRSEHHGNIEYRRLSKEHGGEHDAELAQGLRERRLTVRECARLQTFPDDYRFVFGGDGERAGVAASEAYKIIGNAVPCVLAYNLAMNLAAKWNRWFKQRG